MEFLLKKKIHEKIYILKEFSAKTYVTFFYHKMIFDESFTRKYRRYISLRVSLVKSGRPNFLSNFSMKSFPGCLPKNFLGFLSKFLYIPTRASPKSSLGFFPDSFSEQIPKITPRFWVILLEFLAIANKIPCNTLGKISGENTKTKIEDILIAASKKNTGKTSDATRKEF